MIGKESKLKGVASINEVMSILEERRKRGEWIYEQQRSYEHAEKVSPAKERSKKVFKELVALDFIDEMTATKITDIMPANLMLLKQVIAGENKSYDEDQVNKIFAITSGK